MDGFDFDNPAIRANPYPAYRMLREAAPIWRAPSGHWIVSTHAGCAALMRDPLMGRTANAPLAPELSAEPVIANLSRMMLFQDPPNHTRLRGLVARAFTARRIESLRPRIESIVDELIDAVFDQGGMDLVADFAHKLPVTVICDMLGVPQEDRPRFLEQSSVRGRILDPVALTREELDEANESFSGSDAYFRALFVYRREHPGDDLTTALLAAREADDSLNEDEIISNISLLFGAGHETTANLIGNGLLALYRNPDQLDRLKRDPALIPHAIEELLRYDSPVQLTARFALQPVGFMGQRIGAGEEVIALLGAANHDPAAFHGDPDTLDVIRPDVRPISFGGGIHYCLGAQLARIEGEIAFRRLFERLPTLRIENTDEVVWKPTITLRGLAALPATW